MLLTADHWYAWERWIAGRPQMERLGFERFVDQEFRCRQPLYELAHRIIDVTGRTVTGVGNELARLVHAVG